MSGFSDRGKAAQARWFIVALLLALASALVPALCSQGLASSRSLGSAFDPTTSTVAIRSHAQLIEQAEIALPDDTGAGDTPTASLTPALFAATVAAVTFAALAHPAARPIALPARRNAQRRMTLAQPRAPPFSKA